MNTNLIKIIFGLVYGIYTLGITYLGNWSAWFNQASLIIFAWAFGEVFIMLSIFEIILNKKEDKKQ